MRSIIALIGFLLLFFVVGLSAATVSAVPFGAETKINPTDATDGDQFGGSVAIDGGIAIIGAGSDDGVGTDSGSAYLFDAIGGNQLFKLTADDARANAQFGNWVGISGNTAIVGAHFDSGTGSSYLFDVSTGTQLWKLNASDAGSGNQFGFSVDISGNVAIAGAIGNTSNAGAAYLFDVTTGNQLFKLTADDAAPGDALGFEVGISGNTAIVGAPRRDDAGDLSGAAYLFDVTTGNQLFKLNALDANMNDQFGWAVAISGNIAIVGAIFDDDGGQNAGAAYLFDVITGNQLFKLTADDAAAGDFFGESVSISGNIAIVGASADDDVPLQSGSAYLFDVTTGNQLLKLTAEDASPEDRFGNSVGISGTRAIVGAVVDMTLGIDDGIGSASGSAYLFTPEPSSLLLVLLAAGGLLSGRRIYQ